MAVGLRANSIRPKCALEIKILKIDFFWHIENFNLNKKYWETLKKLEINTYILYILSQ